MNWLRRSILIVAIFAVGALSGSMIMSANAENTGLVDPSQPGSVNDPLITKSYVDEVIGKQIADEVNKQIAAKQTEMAELIASFQDQIKDLVGQASGLTVVELAKGQTLFADAGTTVIVRNGTTQAVSDTTDGIPDLTGGKDLKNGTAIPINHLLMFPREGRGVKSTFDQTIYLMVVGSYKITNADGTVVR